MMIDWNRVRSAVATAEGLLVVEERGDGTLGAPVYAQQTYRSPQPPTTPSTGKISAVLWGLGHGNVWDDFAVIQVVSKGDLNSVGAALAQGFRIPIRATTLDGKLVLGQWSVPQQITPITIVK